MTNKVDISLVFYGKPYNTMVTIESLMRVSGQWIDKIYLTHEKKQPHGDWDGIFKIIDIFKNKKINGHTVNLVIFKPKYFMSVGFKDLASTLKNKDLRQSIMFQYPLETSDKKYLCTVHNDMLFHKDMIPDMIKKMESNPTKVAGVGSVGQCWSCPAGPNWGNVCQSNNYFNYVPTQKEAIDLHQKHHTPRKDLDIKIIESGRVHPLPECRLNEYFAMIDTEKYRKNTIPNGNIPCYGANWEGADLATSWTYEMHHLGYIFKHITLEDYVQHAPFDLTKSGTEATFNSNKYLVSENNAKKYFEENYYTLNYSNQFYINKSIDTLKRTTKGFLIKIINTFLALKS
ncbi:MAG: hypothetical protein KA313_09005 [Pseudarcicella sp.]|nr:hypothetical protein [Pseudarcicella sp.]MBP6411223.1 hypothetical protein [Pseudarcicella sp.]